MNNDLTSTSSISRGRNPMAGYDRGRNPIAGYRAPMAGYRQPLAGSFSCWISHPFDSSKRDECNYNADLARLDPGSQSSGSPASSGGSSSSSGSSTASNIGSGIGEFIGNMFKSWFAPPVPMAPPAPNYTPLIIAGAVGVAAIYFLNRKKAA